MTQLNWIFSRFVERLGLAGSIALVSLLSLILVTFFIWQPAKQTLQAMETTNQGPHATQSQLSPEQELNAFVAQFPNNAHRVESIATIIDTAAEMGLGLDNIAYKTKQIQGDQLNHYHIDFNVVGNYEDVRRYLVEVMTEMPTVSLDTLSMGRQDVEQDFIQARVRLTLHFAS